MCKRGIDAVEEPGRPENAPSRCSSDLLQPPRTGAIHEVLRALRLRFLADHVDHSTLTRTRASIQHRVGAFEDLDFFDVIDQSVGAIARQRHAVDEEEIVTRLLSDSPNRVPFINSILNLRDYSRRVFQSG